MHKLTTALEPFATTLFNSPDDSLCVKTANALLAAAKAQPLTIDADLGFCYAGQTLAVGYTYGTGIFCNENKMNKLIEAHPEDADDLIFIRDNIWDYCGGVVASKYFDKLDKELIDNTVLWGGTWCGHAVPNLIDAAKYGTDGIRQKVEKYRAVNPGKDDFYDSILTVMDAIDVLGKRFSDMAEEMLAGTSLSEKQRKNLEIIRETLTHAPKAPCKTFPEACIVYVMVYTFDGIDSPGYFDQYMYEFWSATEPKLRREYLENIWEFFHNTRSWNLCICGSDENWNDRTNDLSLEILDVTAKYKYQTPNLTLRCHRNTPESVLRAAYRAIATGCGMPTFYNDEAVCPALERLGIPPHDAHLYVMNGCNQIDIQGKSHMGLEDGEVNIAMAVELTLHNGMSEKKNKKFGIETGDPCDFKDFDEFFSAFMRQLDYLTDKATAMSNKGQRALAEGTANPLRSTFIEGCIEKGVDYKCGGPLYGHGQILAEGVADAIDSVAAVKKYVYDEKRFTMAELVDALNKDFEGYEDMYLTLKNSELKFGNDNDYVDSLGAEIIDHFNKRLLATPTYRGGFFGGGCSPYVRAASNGRAASALPNGKRRDEYLFADSIGATPGFDTNGPTALLKSCLKFDHTLPTSGFVLNIKFDKELFCSEAGEEGFLALHRTYFGEGGQQLSVTVVSTEELLDAKEHPENHRDLIVRVGGYSDYFTNLSQDLQDNVIARTMYKKM